MFSFTLRAVLTPLTSSKNVSCPNILFNSKNVTYAFPKTQDQRSLFLLVNWI